MKRESGFVLFDNINEFEKYRVKQDQLYQSDFDRVLLELETEEVSDGKNEQ